MEIKIFKDILGSNEEKAKEIRDLLGEKKVYMIDMMSSPGSGKTTLIDKLLDDLKKKYKIAIIEGDVETANDAERLAKHDIPIIQIETALFRRDCHLESSWIRKCLDDFNLDELDLVIIENIGNLVCPAEFELGDDERMVILSITEGEDKPVKYPMMFTSSKSVVINKMDLLPHLDFNMEELMENVRKINPKLKTFHASSKTGEGISGIVEYISGRINEKKQ